MNPKHDTNGIKKKERELNPDTFEALLRWLAPDREEAGKRDEEIRHRLIRIFACRGCSECARTDNSPGDVPLERR